MGGMVRRAVSPEGCRSAFPAARHRRGPASPHGAKLVRLSPARRDPSCSCEESRALGWQPTSRVDAPLRNWPRITSRFAEPAPGATRFATPNRAADHRRGARVRGTEPRGTRHHRETANQLPASSFGIAVFVRKAVNGATDSAIFNGGRPNVARPHPFGFVFSARFDAMIAPHRQTLGHPGRRPWVRFSGPFADPRRRFVGDAGSGAWSAGVVSFGGLVARLASSFRIRDRGSASSRDGPRWGVEVVGGSGND